MNSSGTIKDDFILVVEDNLADSYVLARYLRAAGLNVVETRSIAEAKSAIPRGPLIAFIDVGLPDGDGMELCREIKQHPETSHISVVLVSATRNTDSGLSAFLECGAHTLLVKPVVVEELIPLVHSLVKSATAERDSRA